MRARHTHNQLRTISQYKTQVNTAQYKQAQVKRMYNSICKNYQVPTE